MDMTWRQAAIKVLTDAKSAMHYSDITDKIIENEYRKNVGATPAASVSVTLNYDINEKSEASTFVRVSPGVYMLRPGAKATIADEKDALPDKKAAKLAEEESSPGLIQAFGMYWRRENVDWTNNPKLWGQQQQGATEVDFGPQIGVYILFDNRDVIYVGRATDQPLGKRLYQHTFDRLTTRWNRFSWFGLQRVTSTGQLEPANFGSLKADDIVTALEAILIEGMEPPQNRRRGDDFRAVEYIQVKDRKLKKKELSAIMEKLKSQIEDD